jgi:hypothetical protein
MFDRLMRRKILSGCHFFEWFSITSIRINLAEFLPKN